MLAHLPLGHAAGEPLDRRVDDSGPVRGDRFAHPAVHVRRAQRQLSQPPVGEAHRLQAPHLDRVLRQSLVADLRFRIDDLLQALEKPGIEAGNLVDPLDREALPERFAGDQQPVGRRLGQRILDDDRVDALQLAHAVEPGQPRLKPSQRLLQAFRERYGRSP